MKTKILILFCLQPLFLHGQCDYFYEKCDSTKKVCSAIIKRDINDRLGKAILLIQKVKAQKKYVYSIAFQIHNSKNETNTKITDTISIQLDDDSSINLAARSHNWVSGPPSEITTGGRITSKNFLVQDAQMEMFCNNTIKSVLVRTSTGIRLYEFTNEWQSETKRSFSCIKYKSW